MNREKFIIFHTARNVDYTITGFRTKNMDEVRKELSDCVEESSDPLIAAVYT
jgi:myosin heavy subunit